MDKNSRIKIGERLREERERRGFTQTQMGELGGVRKLAQSSYERGERSPDADYLSMVAEAGCDVQYIVTGVRGAISQHNNLDKLLKAYMELGEEINGLTANHS